MTETALHRHHDRAPAAEAAMVKDPVCGMTVNPQEALHRAAYEGQTYYFCCAGCRTKFTADPQRYLGKETKAPRPMLDRKQGTRSTTRKGRGLRHDCRRECR